MDPQGNTNSSFGRSDAGAQDQARAAQRQADQAYERAEEAHGRIDDLPRRDRQDSPSAMPAGGTRTDDDRVIMTNDDIQVITGGEDLGIFRARHRFGGFDLMASIAGLLAGIGMMAVLAGLAGGVGTVGYQLDVERGAEELSTGGFIAGAVIVVLSFLVAGWVAGRASRYDGGRNGAITSCLFVVLSAVLAGLGAWLGDEYNVFANIRVPQWFTSQATTLTAVLSAIVGIIVILACGWLGGKIGERYHRKVDRYLAEYAQGNGPTAMTASADEYDEARAKQARSSQGSLVR